MIAGSACERTIESMTSSRLLAVSGKMASGKDAVAEAALAAAGFTEVRRLKIADAIRTTLDEYLGMNRAGGAGIAERLAAVAAQVPSAQRDIADALVRRLVDLFAIVAATEPGLTAHDRTNTSRALLQDLARLHRLADPDVWVKTHIARLATITEPGVVVLTTDVREPNEALLLHQHGYLLARVVVSPEVQLQRLQGRDGITVDPATLVHPNETALDRISGELADAFDIFIDNDGELGVAAAALGSLLIRRWGRP
jgi:dephospho-CoA kinase